MGTQAKIFSFLQRGATENVAGDCGLLRGVGGSVNPKPRPYAKLFESSIGANGDSQIAMANESLSLDAWRDVRVKLPRVAGDLFR
jgi:hypothetical protein